MMKIRKDNHLSIHGLFAIFCIVSGAATTTLAAMAIIQAPHAGNLWLVMFLTVSVLLTGVAILGYSLWRDLKDVRHGDNNAAP